MCATEPPEHDPHYNMARALVLHNSNWISIYTRPCVYNMMCAVSIRLQNLGRVQCKLLLFMFRQCDNVKITLSNPNLLRALDFFQVKIFA